MVDEQRQAAPAPKKGLLQSKAIKLLLLFAIIIVAGIAVTSIYVTSTLSRLNTQQAQLLAVKPTASITLISQNLLSYNNGTQIVPFEYIGYNEKNVSQVSMVVSLYQSNPQIGHIYVLNWSDQCYRCGNVNAVLSSLNKNLSKYGIQNSSQTVQEVSKNALPFLGRGSVLVILNGLLPDYMLNDYGGTSTTLIQYLLNNGVTILYAGGPFTTVVGSQNQPQPYSAQALPYYLQTGQFPAPANRTSVFFDNATYYAFYSGRTYGSAVYTYAANASIVAFTRFPDQWKTPGELGYDLATAISLQFWNAPYAQGRAFFTPPQTSTSYANVIGVVLSPISPARKTSLQNTVPLLNSLYGKIATIISSQAGNTVYLNTYFTPRYSLNGTFAMPVSIQPAQQFNATIAIPISSAQVLEPHITILTSNLTTVTQYPPLFAKSVSPPNYTFIRQFAFTLGQGSYIALVQGSSNQQYAASYFQAPPITVSVSSVNVNASTIVFSVLAGQIPLSNVTAKVSYNGKYRQLINVSNGQISYTLPNSTSIPAGKLNFTIGMLFNNYSVQYVYTAPPVVLNKQYVEFIIALVVVILEISLVKAPTRDEFYIDVPSMPRPQSTKIKIKENELLGVFDKLNIYYKWRYMPLSKTEFRFGVSKYVHYNAMSVMMTYKNVERMLDSMVERGDLIAADDLYAPKAWIDQSKHDIEYLATFKKLRVYLVGKVDQFTDMDKSENADIVATMHNERAYIIIYSKTSKYQKIPIARSGKTYLAFINSDKLDEFKKRLYDSTSRESEELKMYISSGTLQLMDSDAPEGLFT